MNWFISKSLEHSFSAIYLHCWLHNCHPFGNYNSEQFIYWNSSTLFILLKTNECCSIIKLWSAYFWSYVNKHSYWFSIYSIPSAKRRSKNRLIRIFNVFNLNTEPFGLMYLVCGCLLIIGMLLFFSLSSVDRFGMLGHKQF